MSRELSTLVCPAKRVAERLGVPESELPELVARGDVPPPVGQRNDGTLLFDTIKVHRWAKAQRKAESDALLAELLK